MEFVTTQRHARNIGFIFDEHLYLCKQTSFFSPSSALFTASHLYMQSWPPNSKTSTTAVSGCL